MGSREATAGGGTRDGAPPPYIQIEIDIEISKK